MNIEFRAFVGEYDWGWIKQFLPTLRQTFDMKGITAVDSDTNETVGMVIFDTWMDNAVYCQVAVKTPMLWRHGFFEEMADYLFNFCEKDYCYALIADNNFRSLKAAKKLGFKELTRLPKAVDKETDYIMLSVHKADYLKMPNIEKKGVA